MFKLKGIKPSIELNTADNTYGVYEWDDNPSDDNKDEHDHHAWQFTGGDDTFYNSGRFSAENPSEMYLFNEEFGDKYLLKSLNAAQDGPDSDEWWINGLLIFNVDGSAHERDKNTGFYPNIRDDYENTDEAWINSRKFLEDNSERLLMVYRQLPGFENADFVWEKDANDQSHITVGDILYIRETVHTSQDRESIGNETENNNYAVTQHHCHYAAHPDEKDNPNNRQSIGFNFYESDIHPFKKDDYINIVQDLSAVTAACFMVRKQLYIDMLGFDEKLAVAFNDVDFCMKIRTAKYLIVYNPFVEAYHYESKSRGEDTENTEKQKRFAKEYELFVKRWSKVIAKGDPYYNKNYRLDTDLPKINYNKISY